jgi:protein O-GlcNAc transferase
MSSRNERRAARKNKKKDSNGASIHVTDIRVFEVYNSAVVARREGNIENAKKLFRTSLKLKPDFFEALGNLGLIYEGERNYPEALKYYMKAFQLNAQDKVLQNNIGNLYFQSGLYKESEDWLRKALLIDAMYVPAINNLGNLYAKQQRYQEAEAHLKQVLELAPDLVDTYVNLAAALNLQKRYDEALVVLEKAKQIAPGRADIYFNSGLILADKYFELVLSEVAISANTPKGDDVLVRAIDAYKRAIEINERYLQAHINLAVIYGKFSRIDEAIHTYRSALKLCSLLEGAETKIARPQDCSMLTACERAHSAYLFLLNYSESLSNEDLCRAHQEYAFKYADELIPKKIRHANITSPGDKYKIGYVSPDFRSHSVAYFLEPILANHNRDEFAIYCYANVKQTDSVTERFKQYGHTWCNIANLSDKEVSQRIQDDRIDILVDLAGYTGDNRLQVFARKPAPIQVSYLGYPNTTGMAAMDYRLTDTYADPDGQEQFYTEKLVRLPQSFLCYRPPQPSPEVKFSPCIQTGQITFGCFNTMHKINSGVIKTWSEILKIVPDSRLILKNAAMQHRHLRARLCEEFAALGVQVDRLVLMHRTPDVESHIATYHQVDIALDTFPYNGATTTCEALWMGVPVVGMAGQRHASRVGISLLSNIGLPELIGQSAAEYIRLAVALAGDPNQLQALRLSMRERLEVSPLRQEQQFVRQLEAIYYKLATKNS